MSEANCVRWGIQAIPPPKNRLHGFSAMPSAGEDNSQLL